MSEQDKLVERISRDIQRTLQNVVPTLTIENCMEAVHRINMSACTTPEKEIVVHRMDTEEPILLIPIGDSHLGSATTNLEMMKRTAQVILSTPNCYTILVGDLAESCTKASVGMAVFEEDFNIPEQLTVLYALLKPLADAGKILGAVIGNHEMRIAYATKLNPVKMLCEKLGVPYLGFQGYILIKTRKLVYRIFVHHGTGGGSTPGAKRNAMRSACKIADMDLYLTGHTHDCLFDQDVVYTIDEYTEKIVAKKRYYAVCGSALDYFEGYPEMKGLPPALPGVIMLILDPITKDIRAFM